MGNREASQATVLRLSAHRILLSEPRWTALCPESVFQRLSGGLRMCLCPLVEAMQSLGHRPSMYMERMPPTLVPENSVL